MEGLLTKLADVTYDIVGVLMPGLVLVLVGVIQWHVYSSLSAAMPMWNDFVARLQSDVQHLEDHAWSSFFAAVIVSYLCGRVVLLVARNGFPIWACVAENLLEKVREAQVDYEKSRRAEGELSAETAPISTTPPQRVLGADDPRPRRQPVSTVVKRVAARLFLVRTPRGLLGSHTETLRPLRDFCAAEFGPPDTTPNPLVEWTPFQLISTRVVEQQGVKTRFQIHQYKYTLDRSLATVFAFAFWSSVGLMSVGLSCWPLLALEAALFVLLVYVFDDEHAFHWDLWGNTVIADVYANSVAARKAGDQ